MGEGTGATATGTVIAGGATSGQDRGWEEEEVHAATVTVQVTGQVTGRVTVAAGTTMGEEVGWEEVEQGLEVRRCRMTGMVKQVRLRLGRALFGTSLQWHRQRARRLER